MTLDSNKLQQIIQKNILAKSKNIILHCDTLFCLKNITCLKDFEFFVTTSNLRYTQGSKDPLPKIFDCVIYLIDSHEAKDKIKKIMKEYNEISPLILIGDKKSTKSLLKTYNYKQKYYQNNYLICIFEKDTIKESVQKENYMITETINNKVLKFQTTKGIFSYKKIDEGTKFLLEKMPEIGNNKVLDFACGYGAIGIATKKLNPEIDLTMIDSSYDAINCAKKNVTENNIPDVKILESYLLDNNKEKFDVILSNPPTHMNLDEANILMKQFKKALMPKGQIYLVINNIVNYEKIANNYFKKVNIFSQKNKFKIIQISN